MTNTNLVYAMGRIDPRLIEDAAPDALPRGNAKKVWMKLVSLAACFALVFGAAVWLFVPYFGVREDSATFITFEIGDGYHAAYIEIDEMSRFDRYTLEGRLGELYLEDGARSLYKIKGHEDIAELIEISSDGEVNLFVFSELVKEFEAEPCSFSFLLEKIYCVTSAEDIRSVKFEKEEYSTADIFGKVKVDKVTVTDEENLAKIFDMFGKLSETRIVPKEHINPRSEEYLSGTRPLWIQTFRKVTISFKNDTSIELTLDPYNKWLCLGNTNDFVGFTDEDIDWLIGLAEINMEYVDYGTYEEKSYEGPMEGDETETPRPIPIP